MGFLEKKIYPKQIAYYILFFVVFLSMNSLKVLASENKMFFRKNQENNDFEKVYFQYSIPFDEYDSSSGQIKSFFGLKSDQSTTNYYPDLNIMSRSDALREIYRSKLNDMIEDRFIYKLKK